MTFGERFFQHSFPVMTLVYLSREYLFYDVVMAVLFQVHLREEPIEYSHRERKAELHLKSFLMASC